MPAWPEVSGAAPEILRSVAIVQLQSALRAAHHGRRYTPHPCPNKHGAALAVRKNSPTSMVPLKPKHVKNEAAAPPPLPPPRRAVGTVVVRRRVNAPPTTTPCPTGTAHVPIPKSLRGTTNQSWKQKKSNDAGVNSPTTNEHDWFTRIVVNE